MQGIAGVLRLLTVVMMLLAVNVPPAYSQDEAEVEDTADAATVDGESETAAEDPESAPDVLQTDDESYRDIDDRDFTPSEEIPADQSITFPTDI